MLGTCKAYSSLGAELIAAYITTWLLRIPFSCNASRAHCVQWIELAVLR